MRLLAVLGIASVLACSNKAAETEPHKGSSPQAGNGPATQQTEPPAHDAAPDPKKPRGWQAYEKRKGTEHKQFETAQDGTVVGTDGTELVLSDVWKDHNVALVFYRGHW